MAQPSPGRSLREGTASESCVRLVVTQSMGIGVQARPGPITYFLKNNFECLDNLLYEITEKSTVMWTGGFRARLSLNGLHSLRHRNLGKNCLLTVRLLNLNRKSLNLILSLKVLETVVVFAQQDKMVSSSLYQENRNQPTETV